MIDRQRQTERMGAESRHQSAAAVVPLLRDEEAAGTNSRDKARENSTAGTVTGVTTDKPNA